MYTGTSCQLFHKKPRLSDSNGADGGDGSSSSSTNGASSACGPLKTPSLHLTSSDNGGSNDGDGSSNSTSGASTPPGPLKTSSLPAFTSTTTASVEARLLSMKFRSGNEALRAAFNLRSLPMMHHFIRTMWADPNTAKYGKGDRSVFHQAIAMRRLDIAKSLWEEYKINLEDRCQLQETPLMTASRIPDEGSGVQFMLGLEGVSGTLDCTNARGSTALHLALRFGSPDSALMLIQAGVKTQIEDGNGHTAADYVFEKHHSDQT